MEGYTLDNNVCKACVSNTATCSISTYTLKTLTSCNTGYYKSALTTCSPCTNTALKGGDGTTTLLN
jgi:hypothetical protein